jgi:hypothetical protein
MADFSIILEHPDKDHIISQLLSGVDPREIIQWLKLKYPDKESSHLKISLKLLRDFSQSDFVNYYNQLSKDISLAKTGKLDKVDRKLSDSIVNNKTYKERLNEALQSEIDIKKRFLELDIIVRDRMEQIFDKIQENPGQFKGDYVFIQYLGKYMELAEKWNKTVNNAPDQIIQHNYTVNYIDQQTIVIQDAIRETLAEMDPEASLVFIDKLNEKLEKLKPKDHLSSEDIVKEAEIIQQKLLESTEKL